MLFLDLGWFDKGLRQVFAFFCRWIYAAISLLYDLFINISKVNILSSDTVQPMYQRVTIILTIIMVFYVTFEFVKFIVQPDGITDKEKGVGNIVYKMIAVIVLIAFVPTIFTGAFKLQTTIVDKGIIGKVILGKNGNISDNFGGQFSASMLSMFYGVNEKYADEDCEGIPCSVLVGMNLKSLESESNFFSKLPYLTTGLGAAKEETQEVEGKQAKTQVAFIEFDGLFALCVGGFVCYILLLYCIDVGVRWAQLIYLQIIAPIPIIGFLSPKKDGIFQKWCKQCITTYLDLFIRITLIYFIILICSILTDPLKSGELMVSGVSETMELFINIALIMGLLLFGHKAPKMLKELFPSTGAASGNFGLKAGERVAPEAARVIGAGVGGLNAMARKGIAQAQATKKRNAEIRERRRAEGKDISRAAVRQERRQADLDAKAAKRKQEQARRAYDQQQRATKNERKAVLAAEKELAEAKRSGDKTKIANAQQKHDRAMEAYNVKKAALAAGNNGGIVADAQMYSSRKQARDDAKTELDNANKNVANQELERRNKEKAVSSAEAALAEAQKSNDPNAIAQAQANLTQAIQERDGSMSIYTQDQIIAQSNADISNFNAQIAQNEQTLAAEREKHTNATNAVVDAQNKLNDVTMQGDKEIAAAKSVLQQAQNEAKITGDQTQVKLAEAEVAAAIHNKNMAVTRATNELTHAQNQESIASNNLKQTEATISSENSRLRSTIQLKEADRRNAENLRAQAITARDQNYTQASQERDRKQAIFEQKEQEFSPSSQAIQQYSDKLQKDYEQAKKDRINLEDIQADTAKNSYRPNAILSGLAGAATGITTGVKTGFEAQKIEDISKKVQEGQKKVKEQVIQHEKWLDSGGTSNISRIISKTQQNLGFSTEAQRIEQEIKTIESDVKSLEATNSGESAIFQSADQVKDNNIKKMEEGKLNTKIAKDQTVKVGNSSFTMKAGENVSVAYGRIQTDVDVAEQKLKNVTENGSEEEIREAQQDLAEKRQLAKQATKKLHEESFDQILKAIEEYKKDPSKQDPRTNPEFDAGSVQKTYETLWNIENSRNNADTVRSMRELLDNDVYESYIGIKPIDNFATYDKIEKALKTSTGKRTEKITNKKQQQQILSGSGAYAAHKADDTAANSGK